MSMIVKIKGKNEKISRKELLFATKYFAINLMSERLCKNLTINLTCDINHYCHGSSVWVDSNHKPREFDVTVNARLGKRTQLITLAHEMVHVKQHATNELKNMLMRREDRWQGRYIKEDEMHYFEKPWEVEAFGRELGLYQMYMQLKRDNKLKF
jgi:hypothetical protein